MRYIIAFLAAREFIMNITNMAAYKFISLTDLPLLQAKLKEKCQLLRLKGTILLSHEGINLMLAGTLEAMAEFKHYLLSDERFADLDIKESVSVKQPFKRMWVKVKKEIITLGSPGIHPEKNRAPAVSAKELCQWLQEGRDITLLDARNDYEIAYGTFNNAIHLNLKHFRHFPAALKQLDQSLKNKPIVTFCTGGIRCEKAALVLQDAGFRDVYQLDGGILKYFADCGGVYYDGNCFVFDERIAVDSKLQCCQPSQSDE